MTEPGARGEWGRGVWERVPDPPGSPDRPGHEDLQTGPAVHRSPGDTPSICVP